MASNGPLVSNSGHNPTKLDTTQQMMVQNWTQLNKSEHNWTKVESALRFFHDPTNAMHCNVPARYNIITNWFWCIVGGISSKVVLVVMIRKSPWRVPVVPLVVVLVVLCDDQKESLGIPVVPLEGPSWLADPLHTRANNYSALT